MCKKKKISKWVEINFTVLFSTLKLQEKIFLDHLIICFIFTPPVSVFYAPEVVSLVWEIIAKADVR